MTKPPLVSVIIPARDAGPTLERAIEALRCQTLEAPFEVIVVDDGSRDATSEIAQRHAPFVSLLRSPHSEGPGAARNRGAAHAKGPVLAFTDADCFPAPEWLEHGLRASATAELVQGRVVPDPAVTRSPFDRSLEVTGDGGFYQTANLFVRREWFDQVRGFRDWALEQPGRRRWSVDRRRARAARTPIGEDTLFAWTARRLGAASRFAPSAVVYHAVVAGTLADAIADRWHWTRDMPGLVKLVPELRDRVMHGRWFYSASTAEFDLAVAGVIAALISRRPGPLITAAPYVHRLWREAASYPGDGRARTAARRRGSVALGVPVLDAVSLAGFLVGGRQWRCVVL